MPVSKSAKKALRVDIRRRQENLKTRSLLKSALKTFKKAVAGEDASVATDFSKAQSALDRAARKNVIHKNKAARLKSRLSKALPQADAPAAKKPAAAKKAPAAKKPAATATAAKKKAPAKKKAE